MTYRVITAAGALVLCLGLATTASAQNQKQSLTNNSERQGGMGGGQMQQGGMEQGGMEQGGMRRGMKSRKMMKKKMMKRRRM